MSSLLHPTGSEPPQVYWRRRLVVVVVVLLLLVGSAWLAWPKGAPATAPLPDLSASAGPLTSQPASPPAASVSPGPSLSPSPSPSPTGTPGCQAASLRLNLAGFQKLKQGSAQAFKASVTNAGTAACVLELSAKDFAVTVTSGNDRIWSTADCAAWVPTKKVTLSPQKAYEFDLTWAGNRSQATCKTTKDAIAAGTYVAKAEFTGATPARLVMLITAA
jgi:hypothetical protein